MKDIKEIYTELTEKAKDQLSEDLTYVDPDDYLYDVVEETIEDCVVASLYDKENIPSVVAQLNSFFENKSLREEFIDEINKTGFGDDLINGVISNADVKEMEFEDSLNNIKEGRMSFKDLSHDELGKVAGLFYMNKEETYMAEKLLNTSLVKFEDLINDSVQNELAYEYSADENFTVDDLLNYEEKGLDDLIADVKVEEKDSKQIKQRGIEER